MVRLRDACGLHSPPASGNGYLQKHIKPLTMSYRFTNTDKWNDAWFYELDLRQKAVFLYLCDLCDIAGFFEINLRRMAQDIGMSDADVKGALKGLHSRIIYSTDGKYLFLRNFIKHQKNLPFNSSNRAHQGILRLLKEKLQLFNFQSLEEYFQSPMEGASKGLSSPSGIGTSRGNRNNKGGMGEKEREKGEPDEKRNEYKSGDLQSFINTFNEVRGTKFKAIKKVGEQYNARLKEGFTPSQMIDALKNAMNEKYHVDTGYKYLTPEFFTRSEKIDKFLNAPPSGVNPSVAGFEERMRKKLNQEDGNN
jgi:hypothetical protein